MDTEVWGLVGAVIGAATTLVATTVSERGRHRAEAEARRDATHREIRELCATAYVEAVEATLVLNNTYVEDSVDPRWEDQLAPRVTAAVQQARSARAAFRKASAIGDSEACQLAGETAVALGILDQSWHETQDARRGVVEARNRSRAKLADLNERMFETAFGRLLAARELLTGFDGAETVAEAVAAGGSKPGSLLERLRSVAATGPHHKEGLFRARWGRTGEAG
ncbi:hypothetical protein [Cellulomonas fengjieae]|uniref:hypothetical protein n=1 Tax=Cellulomonas fengjieae TaxID=2819978 RepID=UPI001AAF2CD2|nr:hypothetical protein [Cellulomonas fengjieae]MBO3102219.1 hypothetical protein [Cellulomonas fengjieae]